MEDNKVKAILKWSTSTNVKEVRFLLGLANFYHWFIEDFFMIARSLNNLTKKDKAWIWTKKEQQVFDKLKVKFTTALVLAYPEDNVNYHLEYYASNFTTKVVLSFEKKGK